MNLRVCMPFTSMVLAMACLAWPALLPAASGQDLPIHLEAGAWTYHSRVVIGEVNGSAKPMERHWRDCGTGVEVGTRFLLPHTRDTTCSVHAVTPQGDGYHLKMTCVIHVDNVTTTVRSDMTVHELDRGTRLEAEGTLDQVMKLPELPARPARRFILQARVEASRSGMCNMD